jgi:hypothetical protein
MFALMRQAYQSTASQHMRRDNATLFMNVGYAVTA